MMPIYRRGRIENPDSIPLEEFLKPKDLRAAYQQLKNPSRAKLKPRTTYFRTGVIVGLNTSCYFEYGKTRLLALVIPPEDPTIISNIQTNLDQEGQFKVNVKYALFATEYLSEIPSREAAVSVLLHKALDPILCLRSLLAQSLEVRIIVLNDDGCVLSTAVNACVVACIDGGVSIFRFAIASTVAIFQDIVIPNPNDIVGNVIRYINDEDAKDDYGIFCAVMLMPEAEVAACMQKGCMSLQTLSKMQRLTSVMNSNLVDIIQKHFMRKLCKITNIMFPKLSPRKARKRKHDMVDDEDMEIDDVIAMNSVKSGFG